MFISRIRPVVDSTHPFLKLARTTGLYAHLPKYWSCRNHDFNSGWRKFADASPNPLNPRWEDRPDWWDDHVQEQRQAHARCPWPYRHRSYAGYLSYVGNRVSWTWFYMGNPYRPGSLLEVARHQDRRTHLRFLNREERTIREAEQERDRIEIEALVKNWRSA